MDDAALDLLAKYYSRTDWNNLIDSDADKLIYALLVVDYPTILDIIDKIPIIEGNTILTPMFSSIENAIIYAVDLLTMSDYGYDDLGRQLPGCNSYTTGALKKYGECHGKLLASVGIASLNKDHRVIIKITKLGHSFSYLRQPQRYECFTKMTMAIPIIQNMIKIATIQNVSIADELELYHSGSTIGRRVSSTKSLLKLLQNTQCEEICRRLRNIK